MNEKQEYLKQELIRISRSFREPLTNGQWEQIIEKPKTFSEVESLVKSGDISVLIQEERGEKTLFLICDNRRVYEKGEIYEVLVA